MNDKAKQTFQGLVNVIDKEAELIEHAKKIYEDAQNKAIQAIQACTLGGNSYLLFLVEEFENDPSKSALRVITPRDNKMLERIADLIAAKLGIKRP